MKKTLKKSRTIEGELFKIDRLFHRQLSSPPLEHSTEINYKHDIKHLYKILKQCSAAHTLDLEFILQYFSSYNCEQRMLLVRALDYEYEYNLIDKVLERPESPMRSCTLAMIMEPIDLYVRHFHDILVLKKTGKIQSDISGILVEILLALNNKDALKFNETYEQIFQGPVDQDIEIVQGENSIISKLLIHLLEGKRYEDIAHSASLAKMIAQKLYEDDGDDTPGIDHDTIIKIFAYDGFSQLSAIFDVYEDKYDRPIQEAIEREFQGQVEKDCFKDMIEYIRSPGVYYSKKLRQGLYQTPVDYTTLIRIIIGHEDKDLSEIKLEYSKNYDEALEQSINNRIDIAGIKRLFIMIITKKHKTTSNVIGSVFLDNINHTNPVASGIKPTTATSIAGANSLRKNHSSEALNKLTHVFKTIGLR